MKYIPTPEQQAAVQQFAEANGPDWKAKLITAFETHEYGPAVGPYGEMLLNQVAKAYKNRGTK